MKGGLATTFRSIPADSSSSVDLHTSLLLSLVSLLDNYGTRSSRGFPADDIPLPAFLPRLESRPSRETVPRSLFMSRPRERTVLSIFREEVPRRIREREKERFVEIGGFMRDLREMKSRDKFKEVEKRIKWNRNFNISCHPLWKIDRLDDSRNIFLWII